MLLCSIGQPSEVIMELVRLFIAAFITGTWVGVLISGGIMRWPVRNGIYVAIVATLVGSGLLWVLP